MTPVLHKLSIELISEEMPPFAQEEVERSFFIDFKKHLDLMGFECTNFNIYTTAKLIFLEINDLIINSSAYITKIRGPKVDANQNSIYSFCKKYQISTSSLEIKNNYYFYQQVSTPENSLIQVIKEFLSSYKWYKSVRWSNYDLYWIRPLKGICCKLDGKLLDFQFFHLTNQTQHLAHRQLGHQLPFGRDSDICQDYRNKGVIISRNERKEMVLNSFKDLNFSCNDEKLLTEIIGLVDYPRVVSLPEINIFPLPFFIASTALKNHQKIFCVANSEETITVYIVVDRCNDNYLQEVTAGYKRVIDSRIADALYLFKEDLKDFESGALQEKSNNIIIHKAIGTVKDQASRMNKFAQIFSPQHEVILEECKLDLSSKIVNEFPELRGHFSSYLIQTKSSVSVKDNQKKCHIIKNFYNLENLDEQELGYPLSEKFDYLVGLMIANTKVKGSYDPYQLKRTAKAIYNVFTRAYKREELSDCILPCVAAFICIYKYTDKEISYSILNDTDHAIIDKITSFILERYTGKK